MQTSPGPNLIFATNIRSEGMWWTLQDLLDVSDVNLGGTASISTLTDVTLTGLVNNEFLRYDFNISKWVNYTLPNYLLAADLAPYLTIASAASTYLTIVNAASTYYLATNPSSYITLTGISGTAPISYNSTTGVISMHVADTTHDGYLSSTNWNTFNGKQDAITPAALTKVDDTNVTLTLGGTPGTALLQATSLTLGWTGTLADARIASASTWTAKQDALSGSGIVKSTVGTISYISGTSAQFVKADGSLDSSSYRSTASSKFGVSLNGLGGVLTTGVSGSITIVATGTITNWYLSTYSGITGSIQIDVKRSGTSIVGGGGNKPIISASTSATAAVSGWTSTTVTLGDIITFTVDSVSSLIDCTLVILYTLT